MGARLLPGGLRRIPARTWASALRTALYGGIGAFLAIGQRGTEPLVVAVILGVILADYITWFVRSLMQLPANLLHGGYDALVNLLFGGYFFHVADFRIGDDGTSIVVAFLSFMLVLGLKSGYYALQSVQGALEED
jgi:hypothetical protein